MGLLHLAFLCLQRHHVPITSPLLQHGAHAEQYIDIIMIDDVVATGSITTGGVLSENLQEYLSNQDLQ